MQHLVAQLLVVPMHLLNDLLRAADQSRTALDRVLQRVEHGRDTLPAKRRLPGLENRAVREVDPKYYARGVGMIVDEALKLTEYTGGGLSPPPAAAP